MKVETMQQGSDIAASISGKVSVASGAGTAVYATASGQNAIALLSIVFTAATFFVNWYYERRNAQLSEEKAEREYELQMQRLEMERLDKQERRRIMAEWAHAESRREKQSVELLDEVKKLQPFGASGIMPFDSTNIGGGK